MRKALIASVLIFGCGGDDGGGGAGTAASGAGTAASGSDTQGDTCIPGEERCECNAGQCLSGLVCASNVCVALPNDPTNPGGGDSSDDGAASTGDGSCGTAEDCLSWEVCVYGFCTDAWTQSYEISISQFTGCPVDGSGGSELYYNATIDGSVLYTSAVSGCPAGWGNESFVLDNFDGAFSFDFYEEDAFSDDFVTSLCWDTFGDGLCGPFPDSILHDGYWVGSFGADGAYEAEISITLLSP